MRVLYYSAIFCTFYITSLVAHECGSKWSDVSGDLTASPFECKLPCTWMIEANDREKIRLDISRSKILRNEVFLNIWTMKRNRLGYFGTSNELLSDTVEFGSGESLIIHLDCFGRLKMVDVQMSYRKSKENASTPDVDPIKREAHSECTSYLSANTGNIFTPEFEQMRDKTQPCLWLIKADVWESVHLSFIAFQPVISISDYCAIWTWNTDTLKFQSIASSKRHNYKFGRGESVLLFLVRRSEASNWGVYLRYRKGGKSPYVPEPADATTFYEQLYGRRVSVNTELLHTPLIDGKPVHSSYMWMIHMNQDEETSFELFYSKPRIFVDVMIWTMDHDHLHLVAKVRLRYGDREHFVLNRTILVLFDTRDMAQSSEVILRYQKNSRKVYGSNTVRGVTNLSGKNVSQCGEQLLSPRGNISSPSYPKHYSSDISCLWYIKAHTNEEITIKVIDLELYSESFGRLTIWTLDSKALRPYGVYTTKSDKLHYFRPGQSVFLAFHAHEKSGGTRFLLDYTRIVINQPFVPNTLELPEEHEPKSLTEENLQKDPTPSDLDIRKNVLVQQGGPAHPGADEIMVDVEQAIIPSSTDTPSTDSKANTEGRPFAYCLNVLIILSYILA